tara:strand:+ start:247 stop:501 length:255 start_codon:yes stop_codon:yes gene_type:complete
MDILVYTSEGCFYCTQIKKLLQRANLEYKTILVGSLEYPKAKFKDEFPNCKGFPHTIIDGVEYPGIVDVAKLLVKKGLVSAKKE